MLELAIPAVIAAVALASMLGRRQPRERRAWMEAAAELGFRFDDAPTTASLQLIGREAGHRVRVRVIERRQGEGSVQHTAYELRFAEPLKLGTTLRAEGLMSGLGKLIGVRDAEIGDPSFDDRVLIETRDLESLERWLTAKRRMRIRRFLMGHAEARIDDVGLRWVMPHVPTESYVLVGHVESLVRLAKDLVGEGRKPGSVRDEAAERRDHEERQERREHERRKRRRRRRESRRRKEQAKPADASRGGDRPEPARGEPRDIRQPPAPDRTLRDPIAVAQALFGEGLEGLDTSERFEAEFADRPVAWQGTLRRLERVTVDFVFGDGPFTRATIELHRDRADVMGARTVRAVLRLPAEASDELRPRLDQAIVFRGRLVGTDPFSRSLFVAEGEVRLVG